MPWWAMTRCESLLPLSKSLFDRKESVQQEVPQVLIKYAFRGARAEIARPFCREFTTLESEKWLLELYFSSRDRQCSLFALSAHS